MCCHRSNLTFGAGMTASVSFRITRTAEDLAQTITTLSQRLVKLEQRQEALELQLRHQQQDSQRVPEEELATLDGIDQLLRETRDLLEASAIPNSDDGGESDHQDHHHDFHGEEMAA